MAILAAGTFLSTSSISAQPVQPAESADAELALSEGIIEFSRGNFAVALAFFRRANTDDLTTAYYAAQCLMQMDDYAAAVDMLETVVRNPDSPAEAKLDLGVAQLSAGYADSAIQTLNAYLEGQPEDAYGNYFLGVALYRSGRQDESLERFDRAATDEQLGVLADFYLRPDQLPSDAADRQPSPVAGCNVCAEPPRRWNATFLTAYQYDSNVTLSPEFSGLGAGSDIQDSSWIAALYGDYRLVQEATWNVGLIGSAFGNFYFNANDFDAQDYMGGAYTNVLLSENVFFGVRYEFHKTMLDYDDFAREHRLVPSLNFLEGDFGHTTVYYEYDNAQFDDLPLIQAMDRDGDAHAVGLTQAIYTFCGDGRLFFGYRYESTDTQGTDWERDTHMATARIERPLWYGWVGDLEYRHFWDNYENPNSLDFFGRVRNDTRSEVRAGLQRIMADNVSLRLDYTYINQNSTVSNLFGVGFYDYDRHLVAAQFIYDF